jgi:hypothetical protein
MIFRTMDLDFLGRLALADRPSSPAMTLLSGKSMTPAVTGDL